MHLNLIQSRPCREAESQAIVWKCLNSYLASKTSDWGCFAAELFQVILLVRLRVHDNYLAFELFCGLEGSFPKTSHGLPFYLLISQSYTSTITSQSASRIRGTIQFKSNHLKFLTSITIHFYFDFVFIIYSWASRGYAVVLVSIVIVVSNSCLSTRVHA